MSNYFSTYHSNEYYSSDLEEKLIRKLVRSLNINILNGESSKESFQIKLAKNDVHIWVFEKNLSYQKEIIENVWTSFNLMPKIISSYRTCLQIAMGLPIDWIDDYYDLEDLATFVSIGQTIRGSFGVRPPRQNLMREIESNLIESIDISSEASKVVRKVRKLVIEESHRQNLDPRGYTNDPYVNRRGR